jgi:hypothetical protein
MSSEKSKLHFSNPRKSLAKAALKLVIEIFKYSEVIKI